MELSDSEEGVLRKRSRVSKWRDKRRAAESHSFDIEAGPRCNNDIPPNPNEAGPTAPLDRGRCDDIPPDPNEEVGQIIDVPVGELNQGERIGIQQKSFSSNLLEGDEGDEGDISRSSTDNLSHSDKSNEDDSDSSNEIPESNSDSDEGDDGYDHDDHDDHDGNDSSNDSDEPNNLFDDESLDSILRFNQVRTVKESLLLELALSIRHNQTFENLIQSFICKNTLLGRKYFPSSKTELWKVLGRSENGIVPHVYCEVCGGYIGKKTELHGFIECCGKRVPVSKAKFFVSISLKKQLKHFLGIPGIIDKLRYRENRVKKQEGAIEDIFDGQEYQKLPLGQFDYTFCFNTDGCKISKGAKISVYPIFVRINELPPNLRQKFVFLAGLYADNKEPNMLAFWKPFVLQVNHLADEGVVWKPNGFEQVRSKFLPACLSVDGKARSQVLNMNPSSGYFGCTFCTYPGVYHDEVMRYPVQHNGLPDWCMRSHEEMKNDMIASSNPTVDHVRGHKGPSILLLLKNFNLSKGQAFDDLHNTYECAALQHTNLLLTAEGVMIENRMTNASLLRTIDSRLQKVKTPSCVSRKPGTTQMKNRKQFKGTDWRNWLLFTAIPCLSGLIKDVHIQNLALLSHGTYLLSQDIITEDQIQLADEYFKLYLIEFENLFTINKTRLNMHVHLHAGECVKNWGGYWCYTTCNFESWNKKIIMKIKSPQGVIDQVVNRHILHQSLQIETQNDDNLSEDVKDQIIKVLTTRQRTRYARQVGDHMYVCGKSEERHPTNEEAAVLARLSEEYHADKLCVFQKMLIRGVKYTVARHAGAQDSKSDDSSVYTYKDTFCTIRDIVTFQCNGRLVCGMFVMEHDVAQPPPFRYATHISQILDADKDILHFIHASEIRCPVVKVPVLGKMYFIPMMNTYEID